jgi:PKD repeat protein
MADQDDTSAVLWRPTPALRCRPQFASQPKSSDRKGTAMAVVHETGARPGTRAAGEFFCPFTGAAMKSFRNFFRWMPGQQQAPTGTKVAKPRGLRPCVEQLETRETPAVLNVPGLVAAFSFDEGTGTKVFDSTANKLTGTLQGATFTSAGKFGSALNFNGTNNLVLVPDANALDLSTGMTLEAWVRPGAQATDWTTVAIKESATGRAYALYGADNAGRPPAGYLNNGSDKSAVGSSTLPLNTWTHLAVTYDGAALRLFVNGLQVSSTGVSGSIIATNGALSIGGSSILGDYFNGQIDEMRVYNRALTATQIQTDMGTPIGLAGDSLWASDTKPAVQAATDTAAVEVGVKFRSSVAGNVTALRFYKGTGNTGTHVGHLWDSAGNLLATVTFTNETATGWQQAQLSNPVAIQANTTYIVSYYAPKGRYAYSSNYFSSPFANGNLSAPAGSSTSGNGLYRYGTGGGFPTSSYQNMNYWVDVNFSPSGTSGPPTANAGPDKAGNEGTSVSFTGTASGTGLSYLWNFGDGSTATNTLTPTHTYADNGNYTVTLTVTDSLGRTASDTAAVSVSNVAPTADFTNNGPITTGSPVTLSFANQHDASTVDQAAGFRYSYDFDNDGTFDLVNSTNPTATYSFGTAGTYTVKGRLTDKDGGLTDYTTTVTVSDSSGGETPLRTLYVAPTGSDSNNGSASSPWRTLQYAANHAQAGDLIVIRAGHYAGFNIPVSGTAGHHIVFHGEAGAVIDTPTNFGGGTYGINGSGRSYITIEGLTFTPQTGQSEWYSAIRLGGTGSVAWVTGNILRNNTIQMRQVGVSSTPDKYGLYASWQDGIIIANNTISGAYNSGIYVANSSKNYVVSHNEVFNVGGNGIHNNGDAGQGGPGVNVNALIEGNIIHNVGFGMGGQAISCDGVQGSRIVNNLLYDLQAKGISLYVTNAADGSINNLVMNNTVITVGSGAPMRINNDCPGNVVVNNIFVAASATAAWMDAEESGLTGSTLIDYNVTFGVPMVGGVKRNNWKSTYGFDAHSIASTPAAIFANAGAKDYRLKASSPAVDAGTATNAPAKDILNVARPSGGRFDIGAYEYVP